MGIEARGLTVVRIGRTVLRDVDLKIDDGERVCIIGPNGAGKSTLMAALLGLLPAERGEVRLDGAPLDRLGRREVGRRVAYMPQVHEGHLGFTVREVVQSGRYAHVHPLAGLDRADREAVDRAVEACRLGNLLDRPVGTLSGGERQKVWLAAALAQDTPAMFLDEPTAALDPRHQADLIGIMRRYAAAGRTLVVVCHDLNLPPAIGGRVVALRDGAVVFDAAVEQLFDPAVLGALYETTFVLHHGPDGRRSVHLDV